MLNGKHLPGEPTPPPNRCGKNFPCGSDCISRSKVCDFVKDCPDGSDEAQSLCGNPQGFENGLAPWKDSGSETYVFNLHKGSTASSSTGPSADARNVSDGNILKFVWFRE